MADTRCIYCANACGGCSWSRNFTPVKGWNAERRDILGWSGRDYGPKESYFVFECPEFVRDREEPSVAVLSPVRGPNRPKRRVSGPGDYLDAVLRLHKAGLANTDIAKEVGIHASTVAAALKRLGLTRNRPGGRDIYAVYHRETGELLAKGNAAETAKILGVDHTTVRRWATRSGAPYRVELCDKNK